MTVNGTCDDRFSALGELLESNIATGADLGASVAVTLDGETVVDLWGGWLDEAQTTPWRTDTIVNVWSTTKLMTALCALILVDRGELDLDAPVARYWPEFAANGKGGVQVRHVLSHSSGVAGWDTPVTYAQVFDPEESVAMLAAQAPWWKPGTASGYHGLCWGHLVGELVRRSTGLTVGRFFAEQIAGPLGADFHIGLDPAHDRRLSPMVLPPPAPEMADLDLDALDHDSPAYKCFVGPPMDPTLSSQPEWYRSEIAASGNGVGNARSVAQIQSVLSNGGAARSVRLLSPATVDLVYEPQVEGTDLVLGIPLRWGLGAALPDPVSFPYLPDGRVCLWGGLGGSLAVNDLDRRMTFSYVMNKQESFVMGTARGFVGGLRSEPLVRAAYAAIA